MCRWKNIETREHNKRGSFLKRLLVQNKVQNIEILSLTSTCIFQKLMYDILGLNYGILGDASAFENRVTLTIWFFFLLLVSQIKFYESSLQMLVVFLKQNLFAKHCNVIVGKQAVFSHCYLVLKIIRLGAPSLLRNIEYVVESSINHF